MRAWFLVVFAAVIGLTIVGHVVQPSDVAIHFGVGGGADSWAPKIVASAVFLGLHTLLFASFWYLPRLCLLLPAELVNLPNKHYWLAEPNRGRFLELMEDLSARFGVALLLFTGFAELLTIRANLSPPAQLDQRWFMVALIAFLAYTVRWCVQLVRAFRLPT